MIKKGYVDHIVSLKQALNKGLKLIKITKALSFYQDDWLRPYGKLNTDLRKKAKDDFEKDHFKLMINAVYGKTMENVRKQRNIKLVNNDKKRKKLVSEPIYDTTKWFSENLFAIEMKKTSVKMNKPIYLG